MARYTARPDDRQRWKHGHLITYENVMVARRVADIPYEELQSQELRDAVLATDIIIGRAILRSRAAP